jgi:HAD superfamily hydrolase (TIGR01509 family)
MTMSAVLFDLDGTLLDSERESAEAMARALERGLGIVIDQTDRDFIIGRSWVDIYDHLRARYPALAWSRDRLIEATAETRVEVFAELGATVLPGAVEAVRRLAVMPLALVTGSSRREAGQALELLGLEDAFGVVVASEDVPRSKPHPDGYLLAASRLAIAPSRCLAVEDSSAGIAAGRAAGAKVVAVRAGNFAGQDQSAADWVIETLDALTLESAAALFVPAL